MAHILITSGPTRQYLDPVRFLSNASSGRMGAALAETALMRGHEVTIVSGPVNIDYPLAATILPVVSTDEMLTTCQQWFPECDGVIGAAAPCDYRPVRVAPSKISKTGAPIDLHLVETADVISTLAEQRSGEQWVVGFALETDDRRFRALAKLEKKSCDLIVLNGPLAIDSDNNEIEILDSTGATLGSFQGPKSLVARSIFNIIHRELIIPRLAAAQKPI
jgi:phosphopantothenoylcysteine decarboxylase/phosphopantothenate--cysteine ligase